MSSELDDGRSSGVKTGRRQAIALCVLGSLAFAGALIWLVVTASLGQRESLTRKTPPLLTVERDLPRDGRYPGDPYIGSRVCQDCHPGETAFHARSGHATTLRPAGNSKEARALDGQTLADPERSEVQWAYRMEGGDLQVERKAPRAVERWVVDYAFGSGHHATTFVNLLDSWKPSLLEHRLTYYAATKQLGMTPGQDAESRTAEMTPQGNHADARNTKKCFGCHATELSARAIKPIDPSTMIPNVTCERCHGPGRAHVLAARRNADESELVLPFGRGRWTADELHLLCGSCHRHPSKARRGQIREEDAHLARFQPVGVMQSKCFKASGEAFNCTTCHEPHARASADRPAYDLVCKNCHGGRAEKVFASGHKAVSAPSCPREPGGRCVDCHMPKVDAGQYVLFTDHWIRVRTDQDLKKVEKRRAVDLD